MNSCLAGFGYEHKTLHPNDISKIDQVFDHLIEEIFVVAWTDIVATHVKLDNALRVLDFYKKNFALIVKAHDAACDGYICKVVFLLFGKITENIGRVMGNMKQWSRVWVNSQCS